MPLLSSVFTPQCLHSLFNSIFSVLIAHSSRTGSSSCCSSCGRVHACSATRTSSGSSSPGVSSKSSGASLPLPPPASRVSLRFVLFDALLVPVPSSFARNCKQQSTFYELLSPGASRCSATVQYNVHYLVVVFSAVVLCA